VLNSGFGGGAELQQVCRSQEARRIMARRSGLRGSRPIADASLRFSAAGLTKGKAGMGGRAHLSCAIDPGRARPT